MTVAFVSFLVNFVLNQRAAVRARKPVLVFVDEGDGKCWAVRNVGNGPALNVLVAERSRMKGVWFNPVRLPPLGKDASFALTWLGRQNSYGLAATYSDFEDRRYTTTTGGEYSRTYEGDRLPPWGDEREIKRYWELEGRLLVTEYWAERPSEFDVRGPENA